jgi:hypothetical protein
MPSHVARGGASVPAPRRILVVTILTSICAASVARGATLAVDRFDDDPNAQQCTPDPGDCSLRGAVELANALTGADTIELPPGEYALSIPGAAPWSEQDPAVGDVDVRDSVTIHGLGDWNGVLIQVTGPPTAFDVASSLDVTIANLSIRGGGVHAYKSTTLALVNVNVTAGNVAIDPAVANGVPSSLTLESCAIDQDTSQVAALIGADSLTVRNTWIRDNERLGIQFQSATGTALIEGSLIETSVGGIFNTGTMTIRRSTIRDNTFDPHFGASWAAAGIANHGSLLLDSSTVSGNVTTALLGQGNYTQAAGALVSSGPTTIFQSTISGNSVVGADASAAAVADGVVFLTGTQAQLDHSTVTANSGSNGVQVAGGVVSLGGTLLGGPCRDAALYTSTGYNLESPGNTCGFTQPGDKPNVADPRLGPLTDNGGPTYTHLPAVISPAVNAAGAVCPAEDQRGTARPQGIACDIGAVEAVVPGACNGTVGGGALDGAAQALPAVAVGLGWLRARRRRDQRG